MSRSTISSKSNISAKTSILHFITINVVFFLCSITIYNLNPYVCHIIFPSNFSLAD